MLFSPFPFALIFLNVNAQFQEDKDSAVIDPALLTGSVSDREEIFHFALTRGKRTEWDVIINDPIIIFNDFLLNKNKLQLKNVAHYLCI